MKSRSIKWFMPTLMCALLAPQVRGESIFQQGARAFAESAAGKKLNASENFATIGAMRKGGMPLQPRDGGCSTTQSHAVIADLLLWRKRYAELAEYSRLVYERDNLQYAIAHANLEPVERHFQEVNVDKKTSLAYMLVEQPGREGKTEVTLVFEGSTYRNGRTEAINKFINADLAQLSLKTIPEMFRGAEDVYLDVLKQYPTSRARVTVTGHSLGGALATYIGAKFGATAVTFNSSRLSKVAINDAARKRPEILDHGMRSVKNIVHISSSTDTVHFMGIPGQATYLPGESFIFSVGTDTLTGHGMAALSNAMADLAASSPSITQLCANYYGNDASWSALKSKLLSNR